MSLTTAATTATARRILGVDHVAIPTRDPYAAAGFYTTVLNCELTHETRHRSLFLGVTVCPGFMFDLFERGDEEVKRDRGVIHHAFAIGAEDVLWWVEHFKSWGVPFFANPRRGNISIYFQDLDGNDLELYCPDLPDDLARQIPAGVYGSDGSFLAGNKDTLSDEDHHPPILAWPPSERAAEAQRLFEQQLERVRAGNAGH